MDRGGRARAIGHLPPAPGVEWRDRLLVAGVYVIAFAVLGAMVSHRPPTIVDLSLRYLAGHGLALAKPLTFFGTFPVYASISVALLLLGFLKRELLRPVLISVVTLIVAWQVSDACKELFSRPRPNYWYAIHETSLSYPSGHTTLIIAFYGFWTSVVWASDLPASARRWIRLAFVFLALGVGWSRLALGAHYLTDLIGGYLLGAAFASVAMLVFRALAEDDTAGRPQAARLR